ncbi:hypothetical protein N399_08070 [Bacillus licheniformis CG-B52]|nr:hypothetical protein N399_08070 [Bacillus licheniformis CG-B52]
MILRQYLQDKREEEREKARESARKNSQVPWVRVGDMGRE